MRPLLDNITIFLSRLATLRGQSSKLHHARFAHPHELQSLIQSYLG